MPSFLTVQGYVFDTQALKDAYLAVPPAARSSESGYDEAALEALLRYLPTGGLHARTRYEHPQSGRWTH